VYIDLVDTDEEEARRRLLAGVDKSGARPTKVPFPGMAARGAKRFPGQGPEISNLPARNRNFSDRVELLEAAAHEPDEFKRRPAGGRCAAVLGRRTPMAGASTPQRLPAARPHRPVDALLASVSGGWGEQER
jgi:hypothetical protein